jgi:hypothetical protein
MNFGFYLPACPDLEDEDEDALDKGECRLSLS